MLSRSLLIRSSRSIRTSRASALSRLQPFSSTKAARVDSPTHFTNILAGANVPTTQVKTITAEGIHLEGGLIIPSACLFLEGKVFLWNVPATPWEGWKPEHFEVFDTVIPKPELLLLGTGKRAVPPPPHIRQYLGKIGIQADVMDTRNACSTYNLLAEEGRRVAAALLPQSNEQWK